MGLTRRYWLIWALLLATIVGRDLGVHIPWKGAKQVRYRRHFFTFDWAGGRGREYASWRVGGASWEVNRYGAASYTQPRFSWGWGAPKITFYYRWPWKRKL